MSERNRQTWRRTEVAAAADMFEPIQLSVGVHVGEEGCVEQHGQLVTRQQVTGEGGELAARAVASWPPGLRRPKPVIPAACQCCHATDECVARARGKAGHGGRIDVKQIRFGSLGDQQQIAKRRVDQRRRLQPSGVFGDGPQRVRAQSVDGELALADGDDRISGAAGQAATAAQRGAARRLAVAVDLLAALSLALVQGDAEVALATPRLVGSDGVESQRLRMVQNVLFGVVSTLEAKCVTDVTVGVY